VKFRPFAEAKEFVHKLGLKNEHEWREFCKSGKKPKNIPQKPSRTYKQYWKGMGDWLGTYYIATSKRKYRPFNDARKFVHSLGLKSLDEWKDYCKSNKKPADIPVYPDAISSYKKEWNGWKDRLGYEEAPNRLRPYNISYIISCTSRGHSIIIRISKCWCGSQCCLRF